jgi:hypothetical protein
MSERSRRLSLERGPVDLGGIHYSCRGSPNNLHRLALFDVVARLLLRDIGLDRFRRCHVRICAHTIAVLQFRQAATVKRASELRLNC